MNWADEPATEQQVAQLRTLGFNLARPLTLTEAANLIRQYKRQRSHRVPPVALQNREMEQATANVSVSPNPPAPKDLPRRRFELCTHPPQQVPGAAGHVGDACPSPASVQDSGSPDAPRVDFWLDIFREVKDMRVASVKVFELRLKHGAHFLLPSREQAQDILDALDNALPNWERDNPEFFFQTLELNFPELIQR